MEFSGKMDREQVFLVLVSLFNPYKKAFLTELFAKFLDRFISGFPIAFRMTLNCGRVDFQRKYVLWYSVSDSIADKGGVGKNKTGPNVVDEDVDGCLPMSYVSFDDENIKSIVKRFNAEYLENTLGNVHKIPVADVLSSNVRLRKGYILPDGSYSAVNVPYLELELDGKVIEDVNRFLVKRGFDGIRISSVCFGLYKIVLDGYYSRQLLIVVDTQTNLPQASLTLTGKGNFIVKVSDELARTLDGIEIMSWYYESDGEKHFICLGSIINGSKTLEDAGIRLR